MKRKVHNFTPLKVLITISVLSVFISSAAARTPSNFNFFEGSMATNAPDSLSNLGLYSDMAGKTVAPGIYAYDVNVSRWNSGAYTERFLAVPNDSTLTYYGPAGFIYPKGTTFIQNYGIEMTVGDTNTRKLIETRLHVYAGPFTTFGWFGYSYLWDVDQMEARKVDSWTGKDTILTVNLAAGGTDTIPWRYYSQIECGTCHPRSIEISDTLDLFMVLSFVPPQLNRVSAKTGGINQLQYFADDGLIMGAMPLPEQQHSWATLTDVTKPIEHRIQSYYAVNCGHCHGEETLTASSGAYGLHRMDYFLATDTMNYVNVEVTGEYYPIYLIGYDSEGLPIMKRHYGYAIHGGFPDSSVLWLLQNDTEMPSQGTAKKDSAALGILRDWILTLPLPPVVSINHKSPEKTPGPGFIRNNILYLRGEGSSIGLFDLRGRPVKLKFISSGMYHIRQELAPGVYLLKSGNNSRYIYNGP